MDASGPSSYSRCRCLERPSPDIARGSGAAGRPAAALLGLVGLILAFGLALAVGRYEARRAAVVEEANAIADGQQLQRQLWGLAGQALDAAPTASAPRLYVESLNQMIDMQTVHVSALGNRVPARS